MNAFWYQCLLIGIVLVLGGCVDPRVYMNLDVRLLADGYPAEYVTGLMAGTESLCSEMLKDAFSTTPFPSTSPIRLRAPGFCTDKELRVDAQRQLEMELRNGQAYHQGWVDGNNEMARRWALHKEDIRLSQMYWDLPTVDNPKFDNHTKLK